MFLRLGIFQLILGTDNSVKRFCKEPKFKPFGLKISTFTLHVKTEGSERSFVSVEGTLMPN